MFTFSDPYLALELHHQRAMELHRAAAAYRLARQSRTGERRRFGRWPRASAQPRPVGTAVTP
jgi:hypothetical protein